MDVIGILAIVFSPIFAVQVSRFLEDRKQKRQQKFNLFQTLMATRAYKLSHDHVNALNSIDVLFYGNNKKDKKVIEAWKVYLDTLNDGNLKDNSFEVWAEKKEDLFIDLVQKMAVSLKYEFDKSTLRKTSYYPIGHFSSDEDSVKIRTQLVKLLSGESAIPVIVYNAPTEKNITEEDKKDE